MKVTKTVCEVRKSTVQFNPDTLLHPNHPPKSEKIVGIAVSVTCVPPGKVPLHGLPDVGAQKRPGGLLLIVPVPVPLCMTCNWTDAGSFVNLAVTSLVTFDKSTTHVIPDT